MNHPHRLPEEDVARAEYDDGCYVERLGSCVWGYVPAGEERPETVTAGSDEARVRIDTLPLLTERVFA